MPYLDREGDVFVLNLGERGEVDTENRFHPDWMAAMHALLDDVEGAVGPRALVTTSDGKFFSNGLDLEWVTSHADRWEEYVDTAHALLRRIVVLPVICVAALPGHTFAAGAMLALAHDRRVMRADRGFFCLPEVDINIPFTAGMNALITSRLPHRAAHEAMTTGRRYGGLDAAAVGIVDEAVSADEVRSRAMEYADAMTSKAGPTLGAIKSELYADVIAKLAPRVGR